MLFINVDAFAEHARDEDDARVLPEKEEAAAPGKAAEEHDRLLSEVAGEAMGRGGLCGGLCVVSHNGGRRGVEGSSVGAGDNSQRLVVVLPLGDHVLLEKDHQLGQGSPRGEVIALGVERHLEGRVGARELEIRSQGVDESLEVVEVTGVGAAGESWCDERVSLVIYKKFKIVNAS